MPHIGSSLRAFPALAAVWMAIPTLSAQHSSGFEAPLNASPGGTLLTGQDGYYLPATTTQSTDFFAYTYGANTLGVPQNPIGGNQFIAAIGPGNSGGTTTYARAQRDMTYGCVRGMWTAGCECLVAFTGTLPAAQNLGSFSLQPGTNARFIQLARWTDINTATTWDADYLYFDAAGTSVTASVPDPAFQGLTVNRWYRWETDFDFTTNQILEIRLTDILAGTTSTHRPTGWYLTGGAAGAPGPTAFRFFAGAGSSAGNMMAFDNVSIVPAAASIAIYGCGVNPAGSLTVVSGLPSIGTTVVLGVDNPSGGQGAGASPFAVLGLAPDPNFPCGTPIPGLGMASASARGELLVSSILPAAFPGTAWTGPGNPAPVAIPIPGDCVLVGRSIFAQGVLVDGAGVNPVGLADAAQLTFGQ